MRWHYDDSIVVETSVVDQVWQFFDGAWVLVDEWQIKGEPLFLFANREDGETDAPHPYLPGLESFRETRMIGLSDAEKRKKIREAKRAAKEGATDEPRPDPGRGDDRDTRGRRRRWRDAASGLDLVAAHLHEAARPALVVCSKTHDPCAVIEGSSGQRRASTAWYVRGDGGPRRRRGPACSHPQAAVDAGDRGLAVAIVAAMRSRRHDASIRAEARRVSLERATLGTFVTLREASEVIADARTRVGPDVDLARMDRLLQGIRRQSSEMRTPSSV